MMIPSNPCKLQSEWLSKVVKKEWNQFFFGLP
jgi:hypothetical protein